LIPSTIGIQLIAVNKDGDPKDIFSRGHTMEMFGEECQYLGPTPDGRAYFWFGPGDVRNLDTDGLAEAGMILKSTLGNPNGKKARK
jgi:hypothetical protein